MLAHGGVVGLHGKEPAANKDWLGSMWKAFMQVIVSSVAIASKIS